MEQALTQPAGKILFNDSTGFDEMTIIWAPCICTLSAISKDIFSALFWDFNCSLFSPHPIRSNKWLLVIKQWLVQVTVQVRYWLSDFFSVSFLRTYATKYFPYWNIFNTLHTVCFMHGLSIYEIKRICHRAYFFRISYWNLQHLTNFLEI